MVTWPWSRVVTWPTFWKLGQGTARNVTYLGHRWRYRRNSEATNRKSGVADRMVTWPLISGGHVTYFLETRSRYSTKMWHISVTDGDIREIPKATNRKSGVADRMVTWPVISGGHVTYFLETRSRYSTKMWRISVTDGDIGKILKATNRKSGVADRMVTWPYLGGHVTYFLETRLKCST